MKSLTSIRSHQSPRLKPTHAFANFAIVYTSLSRYIWFRGQQKDSFVACKTAQTVGIQIPGSTWFGPLFPSVTRERYSYAFYYIITYLFCQRETTKKVCYFLYNFTRCCVLGRNGKQDVLFGAILRQHENVLAVGGRRSPSQKANDCRKVKINLSF